MTTLLAAILLVESSGNPNPPDGPNGEVGPLQIRQCVVDDVNRFYSLDYNNLNYTLDDMREIRNAVVVFRCYLAMYATPSRLGRPVTDQDRARIWVGGPDGWRKKSTLPYWRKVQRAMKGQR